MTLTTQVSREADLRDRSGQLEISASPPVPHRCSESRETAVGSDKLPEASHLLPRYEAIPSSGLWIGSILRDNSSTGRWFGSHDAMGGSFPDVTFTSTESVALGTVFAYRKLESELRRLGPSMRVKAGSTLKYRKVTDGHRFGSIGKPHRLGDLELER